jgi:hypothetical protein
MWADRKTLIALFYISLIWCMPRNYVSTYFFDDSSEFGCLSIFFVGFPGFGNTWFCLRFIQFLVG